MSDTLQSRVQQRLDELGLNARQASLRAGLSQDFVRKILSIQGSTPHGRNLVALAGVLEVDPNWLLGKLPSDVQVQPPASPATDPRFIQSSSQSGDAVQAMQMGGMELSQWTSPRGGGSIAEALSDVPVRGTAAGSVATAEMGGFALDNVIEYVPRPPGLRGVPNAYAILVTGRSMEPEHKEGDLRFVHPHRRPVAGQSVIVQAQYAADLPVEAYLGEYARETPQRLIIRKLNPECEVEFERKFVRAIHRVLSINEMYGIL